MINRFLVYLILSFFSGLAVAELKALEDDLLSEVSGQAGISAKLDTGFSIGELAYFDDGLGVALQGVKMSSAADPAQLAKYALELDILESGDLSMTFVSMNLARFEIEEIRFVDTPGATPVATDSSIGGIFLEYEGFGSVLAHNRGNSRNGVNNALGGLYDIEFMLYDGRFGYRTNGNEFILDGLELEVSSLGTIFGVTPTGELNLSMPNLLAELRVDAVRFSGAANQGLGDSYGSLWVNLDLDSDLLIKAGGADGNTGMTINSSVDIKRADVAWGDDTDWLNAGYWVGALGVTGNVDLVNMTVDVLDDSDVGSEYNGIGLALAFERLAIDVHVQDFVLGETKSNIDSYISGTSNSIKSLGSFDIGLSFEDSIYNGVARTNRILVQAGGNANAGYQGLRLDTQLSLAGAANESNFVYTDDNYSMMLSGIQGFVDGDITIDVTESGEINGETFYDGMRIGFEDLAFGYQMEGFRIAESTGDKEDLKSKRLQSAQNVQGLGLFASPTLEGAINGHVTLGPGGNEGDEGIAINSDIHVTNGVMGTYLQADGSGNGIWLSGLNYDVHLRDMMLDVTGEGLKIYETESWSKLDVTDFRIGDKVSGASFGGLILESYEKGSETIISAGGAGTVCIGGVGATAGACEADSGRWEDRGDQGLTVSSKRHLVKDAAFPDRVNRFTWHTGRDVDGLGNVDKNSGLKLVFDNYTTNDGDGLTDDFGIQTTYHLDVARTKVVKKHDGPDSNGVDGQKGWEKVMRSDGSYEYVNPNNMTAADIGNRPVGMAMRKNTQFKELDFDRVNLVHSSGNESTLLYGLKLQNFNVTTDLVATPLD